MADHNVDLIKQIDRINKISSNLNKIEDTKDSSELLNKYHQAFDVTGKNYYSQSTRENLIFEILKDLKIQWFDLMFFDPIDQKLKFFLMYSQSESLMRKRDLMGNYYSWIEQNTEDKIGILNEYAYEMKEILIDYSNDTNKSNIVNSNTQYYSSERILKIINDYKDLEDLHSGQFKNARDKIQNYLNTECNSNEIIYEFNSIRLIDFARISIVNKFMYDDIPWNYFYISSISAPQGMQIGSFSCVSEDFFSPSKKALLQLLSNAILFPFTQQYQTLKSITEIKKSNFKSAIAAIMSRQMSHNLGSHVIPGTKYNINNDIFEKKDKNGVIRLFHYLQERMDFISMIVNTQEENKLHGCLNLKAHVLDELAMDGPGIRHNSGDDERCTNFILRHIVKSENIYRFEEFDHIHKTFITQSSNKEGHLPIELKLIKKVDGKYKAFTSIDNGDVKSNDFSQIDIAIPYGVNGRHAFLNILEDFIRNTAKHNKDKIRNLNLLEFSILIQEKGDDSEFDLQLNDNEYLITLFSNKPSDNEELESLKKEFTLIKLLNERNEVDQERKGLKEILICLAWLKDKMNDLAMIENQITVNKNNLEFLPYSENKNLCKYTLIQSPCIINDLPSSLTQHLALQFTLPKYKFIHLIDNKDSVFDHYGNLNFQGIFNLPAAEFYIISDNSNFKILDRSIPHLMNLYDIDDESICTKIKNKDNIWNDIEKAEVYKSYLTNTKCIPLPTLFMLYRDTELNIKTKEFKNNVFRYSDDISKLANLGGNLILFKEHNDMPDRFNKTFEGIKKMVNGENLIKKIKFIEGISGGNYTYNLVISNTINDLEYCRIVDSSLCKIALIDERLFEHYGGKPPVTFKISQVSLTPSQVADEIIADLENNTADLEGTRQRLNEKDFFIEDKVLSQIFEDWDQQIPIKDKLVILLQSSFKPDLSKNILESKGISILNLYDKDNKNFLCDLKGKLFEEINENFEFISIHFSLIEKFSGNSLGEKYDLFIKTFFKNYDYNKIAIHTGRGNLTGLEHRATFIPISTIESQLKNCKHLLFQQFINLKYKF